MNSFDTLDLKMLAGNYDMETSLGGLNLPHINST
jgi:hypothetical protein